MTPTAQNSWIKSAEKIAALEANYNSMAENIREIKDTQKEILKSINSFHEVFVTKDEHKATKEKISEIDRVISGINTKIIFMSGIFATIVFVVEHFLK